MATALHQLSDAVEDAAGELSVTEIGRHWKVSARARARYEKSLRGGPTASYPFTAKPGESMHNGGSAVDLWVYQLNFSGLEPDKWVERLWDLAIPLGFAPIIPYPKFVSECWHLDYRGEFGAVYDWAKNAGRHDAYAQMARCAVLDVGMWRGPEADDALVFVGYAQAQLHRLGVHEVGPVDFIAGRATIAAMNRCFGYPCVTSDPESFVDVAPEFTGMANV